MRVYRKVIILGLAAACMTPASARTAIDGLTDTGGSITGSGIDSEAGSALIVPKGPGHLECVPYARTTSGIQIYGDAHTWWGQAKNRYATGHAPRVGAVMAVQPHNNSRLGHVATVSRVVDSRTILLSHANWSVPGEIERNVTALDVSPANDWSQVRIWYAPARGLGTTRWPVSGFIYNAKPGSVRDLGTTRLAASAEPVKMAPMKVAKSTKTSTGRRNDPIGVIIAGAY
ncbi:MULTISPECIES: CHAP domain-containing protein [unclassified Novosphingobium]|uniref:CHAP domain-containing protein n=1 Tax=unclassified Novosphingobium TaxID=2644732 RepID=UPI00135BC843|nr:MULTISPECIES: CHAP domain-containing protein [unclassified Novosphingobium]